MLTGKDKKNDFSNQDIYVGIDVHKKSWKVSINYNGYEQKTFEQSADAETLSRYLRRNYPGGKYHSVYEAGYSGFWIDYRLKEKGIKNIVVNPADVPTNDKERHNKTDRVDAKKLAKKLCNGDLKGIYVPSRPETEDRGLIRIREWAVKDQTRIKNQIKGLLNFYGEVIPEEEPQRYWSGKYIKWIESLPMQEASGRIMMRDLVDSLRNVRKRIANLTKDIKMLANNERYREKVKLLNTIPGIGIITSMVILTEIIDINRFSGLDKLNSYVGLIPSEHSSGDKEKKGEMTYRGNNSIKRVLVESAWVAARKDPELSLTYKKLCFRMRGNKAIIKIARKLLNRIRYVLMNNKPYKSEEIKTVNNKFRKYIIKSN
jgi:transposase